MRRNRLNRIKRSFHGCANGVPLHFHTKKALARSAFLKFASIALVFDISSGSHIPLIIETLRQLADGDAVGAS